MLRCIFLLIFSVTSISCAFNIKKPVNRFMLPETSGDTLKGRIEAFVAGSARVELINNKFSSSPGTNPSVDKDTDVGVGVHVGVIPRIDFYAATNFDGPNTTGLKFQLLGDTLKDSKKGNWSASLFSGVHWGTQEEESTSGESTKSTIEADFGGYEAGLAVGYRAKDAVILYLNAIYSEVTSDFTMDQTEAGVTTDNLVEAEGEGSFQSLALGFQLGRQLFIQGEVAYIIGNWTRTTAPEVEAEEMSNFVYGVNSGFNW